jgi:hypothetical protein
MDVILMTTGLKFQDLKAIRSIPPLPKYLASSLDLIWPLQHHAS